MGFDIIEKRILTYLYYNVKATISSLKSYTNNNENEIRVALNRLMMHNMVFQRQGCYVLEDTADSLIQLGRFIEEEQKEG